MGGWGGGGHHTEANAGAHGVVSELQHGVSARLDAKR